MPKERTAAPQLHVTELESANVFGEFLRLAVHEKPLPATPRVQAAAGCLIIAQDHHHAIVVLLGSRIYASVFCVDSNSVRSIYSGRVAECLRYRFRSCEILTRGRAT